MQSLGSLQRTNLTVINLNCWFEQRYYKSWNETSLWTCPTWLSGILRLCTWAWKLPWNLLTLNVITSANPASISPGSFLFHGRWLFKSSPGQIFNNWQPGFLSQPGFIKLHRLLCQWTTARWGEGRTMRCPLNMGINNVNYDIKAFECPGLNARGNSAGPCSQGLFFGLLFNILILVLSGIIRQAVPSTTSNGCQGNLYRVHQTLLSPLLQPHDEE